MGALSSLCVSSQLITRPLSIPSKVGLNGANGVQTSWIASFLEGPDKTVGLAAYNTLGQIGGWGGVGSLGFGGVASLLQVLCSYIAHNQRFTTLPIVTPSRRRVPGAVHPGRRPPGLRLLRPRAGPDGGVPGGGGRDGAGPERALGARRQVAGRRRGRLLQPQGRSGEVVREVGSGSGCAGGFAARAGGCWRR
jgi:hypothetical protein